MTLAPKAKKGICRYPYASHLVTLPFSSPCRIRNCRTIDMFSVMKPAEALNYKITRGFDCLLQTVGGDIQSSYGRRYEPMVVETLGVVCKRKASRSFPTTLRLAILSIFVLFMEYQRGRVTDSVVRDSHLTSIEPVRSACRLISYS